MSRVPTHTKALTIQEARVAKKPLYHDAILVERPLAAPKPGEVVVKITATGFNHKDVSSFSS